MATPKGIWYVRFPTYQYNEDVQALAAESGLRILNARFDAGDGAEDVPTLTLKTDEPKPQLFDVYKIVDGERGKRASKADVERAEAESYVAERPDNEYVIVEAAE